MKKYKIKWQSNWDYQINFGVGINWGAQYKLSCREIFTIGIDFLWWNIFITLEYK